MCQDGQGPRTKCFDKDFVKEENLLRAQTKSSHFG